MHRIFPSQQEYERIYLVVREHWAHLLLKFLIWVVFAALLVIVRRFGPPAIPALFAGTAGQVVELLLSLYQMFLVLSAFLIWVLYYLNIQVVTDMRIVDVDQVGLFSHTVSELHIENIEDVTSETNGLFGTIFNFGNVFVQTAGARERFEFDNVPNPAAIEKLLLDLYDKVPHEKRHD